MLQFFFLFLSLALFSLKTSEKFPTRGQPLPPSLALFFFSQILALCFQLSRVPTLSLKLPLTSLLVPLFELSRFLFFSNKNQSPFFCSAQLPFQTSFPFPDITFWNPKRKPPTLSLSSRSSLKMKTSHLFHYSRTHHLSSVLKQILSQPPPWRGGGVFLPHVRVASPSIKSLPSLPSLKKMKTSPSVSPIVHEGSTHSFSVCVRLIFFFTYMTLCYNFSI